MCNVLVRCSYAICYPKSPRIVRKNVHGKNALCENRTLQINLALGSNISKFEENPALLRELYLCEFSCPVTKPHYCEDLSVFTLYVQCP